MIRPVVATQLLQRHFPDFFAESSKEYLFFNNESVRSANPQKVEFDGSLNCTEFNLYSILKLPWWASPSQIREAGDHLLNAIETAVQKVEGSGLAPDPSNPDAPVNHAFRWKRWIMRAREILLCPLSRVCADVHMLWCTAARASAEQGRDNVHRTSHARVPLPPDHPDSARTADERPKPWPGSRSSRTALPLHTLS